jgi:hypothetical protein
MLAIRVLLRNGGWPAPLDRSKDEGPARLFAQCNSNNARWNARDDGGDQLIK